MVDWKLIFIGKSEIKKIILIGISLFVTNSITNDFDKKWYDSNIDILSCFIFAKLTNGDKLDFEKEISIIICDGIYIHDWRHSCLILFSTK